MPDFTAWVSFVQFIIGWRKFSARPKTAPNRFIATAKSTVITPESTSILRHIASATLKNRFAGTATSM